MDEFLKALTAELDPLIAARRDPSREAVVYFTCFYGMGRGGHLFQEPMMMRSMFPAAGHEVFAVHALVAPELAASTRFHTAFRGLQCVAFDRFAAVKDRLTTLDHENTVHRSPVARYLFVSYYK